jgi:peptidoglycan/LPS O-acetylase OafA/YrhL
MLYHINSLRAISVILIIFYHLNLKIFEFGFLGVDIFIVISGYLIAKIISEEINATKKFNIYNFLLRRARRLLPVLYFVLLITVFISYFLTHDDKIFLSSSIISNILLIPNIFFWINNVNYFSEHLINANFLKHTWSLGIEYQFYIFFSFLYLIFNKNLKIFIYTFIVFSFLLDLFLIETKPHASFYLIPTRLWEFLIGSIFYLDREKYFKIFGKIKFIDLISLTLIFINIFYLNNLGLLYKKLIVVFFTAIIILCYKKKQFFSLDNKILNYIGIISFSLYLWHYLIIKLNEYFFLNLKIYQLIFLILILSAFSYHLIEQPFKKSIFYIKKKIIIIIFFIFFIISIFLTKNDYIGIYKYDKEFINSFKISERLEKCIDKSFNINKNYNECFLGNKSIKKIDFILLGDSIAYSLFEGFDNFAKIRNIKGIVLAHSSCPPLNNINFSKASSGNALDRKKNCENFNKEIFEFIFINQIKNVYIIANWENYLNKPIFSDKQEFLDIKPFDNKLEEIRLNILKEGLKRTQAKLNSINVNLIIFNQLPILKFEDAKKIAYKEIQLNEKIKSYSFDKELNKYFFTKNEFISYKSKTEKMFKEIFSNDQIIDLTDFFCNEYCLVTDNKKSLYNDNIHFSYYGSIFFSNILKKIL